MKLTEQQDCLQNTLSGINTYMLPHAIDQSKKSEYYMIKPFSLNKFVPIKLI